MFRSELRSAIFCILFKANMYRLVDFYKLDDFSELLKSALKKSSPD